MAAARATISTSTVVTRARRARRGAAAPGVAPRRCGGSRRWPDVIIAECDAFEVVPSTGRRFTARDIWILNVVDGRLASGRDYWNPLEIIALGADYPTFSRCSLRVKPSCAELLHDSTRGLAPMGCR